MTTKICSLDNYGLVSNGQNIKLIDLETLKVIELETPEVSYLSSGYFTDSEKNFYMIDENKITQICKLKRNIFTLVKHDGIYVADRFGDVYKIENGESKYLLGTMCYITGMAICDQKIWLADKYGRIRVNSMEGNILEFLFEEHPIVCLISLGNTVVSISNNGITAYSPTLVPVRFNFDQELSIKKAIPTGNDSFTIITSEESIIFNYTQNKLELVDRKQESLLDIAYVNNSILKLHSDDTLEYAGNKLTQLSN